MSVGTTGLVDRRAEQAEVRALLAKARLVTLTGPGGVGKTRLAGHVAADVTRAFPDGVRLVELAGLDDPDLVPWAAAEALGLYDPSTRRRPKTPDALADQLGTRRLLLVLDNCEHLHRACAELAGALLHRTTGVRILATSRHRLGLTEEHLLDVRPLPAPDPDGDLSAAHRHPALALFADRAAAVVPGFTLTPANLPAVARLCRRLDGLPLAIELAAARMTDPGDLDADALLARIDDDDHHGHADRHHRPPRHRTLRATIDRSHQLCTPVERLVWERASVLAGDFDLETAEAVCGDGTDDVLEAVTGLVGKSVLSREPGPDGGVRYRLLGTLRRYGLERLRQRPGAERAARRRHRDWTQTRTSAYERAWFGPGQPHMAARLHADRANLRAALDFSLGANGDAPDDALAGLRLAGTLWFHWYACGAPGEGRDRLDRALEANPEPGRERARALWVSGLLGLLTGSAEDRDRGRRRAEEARALAERLGDAAEAAHAGYVVGVGLLLGGEPAAALRHFEDAVAQGPGNRRARGPCRARTCPTGYRTRLLGRGRPGGHRLRERPAGVRGVRRGVGALVRSAGAGPRPHRPCGLVPGRTARPRGPAHRAHPARRPRHRPHPRPARPDRDHPPPHPRTGRRPPRRRRPPPVRPARLRTAGR